jgi:hypothetical protein
MRPPRLRGENRQRDADAVTWSCGALAAEATRPLRPAVDCAAMV